MTLLFELLCRIVIRDAGPAPCAALARMPLWLEDETRD